VASAESVVEPAIAAAAAAAGDWRFADNFDGIQWARLPGYEEPAAPPLRKKSWIFRHGYRVVRTAEPQRIFFICKYCHQRRIIDAGGAGKYEVTRSTSSAIAHLSASTPGHGHNEVGGSALPAAGGGRIAELIKRGSSAPRKQQFDVHSFRVAAVSWVIYNNHPLREFETPDFREMLRMANPEAERALWKSHNSVSRFVLKLYTYMKPLVAQSLSDAASKIHISFDGWSVKGGKRGFLGIIAHFASHDGRVHDLPIALPQLTGVHGGEQIAAAVAEVLLQFGVDGTKIGCFVLDNAHPNNTAIDFLANELDFDAKERRPRCSCHVINLVGQQVIYSKDKDAYSNAEAEAANEAEFMKAWRREGPLGLFFCSC
jgi:hypothetical protein